jgi:hypothetical protein
MGQLLLQRGIRFIGVPQAGKQAAARAMGLVSAFKAQAVDLYQHPALIRDLSKLRIVEKAGNVKLDAPRDRDGHADIGFAVSFLLAAAVEHCRMIPEPQSAAGYELESAHQPRGEIVGRHSGGFQHHHGSEASFYF